MSPFNLTVNKQRVGKEHAAEVELFVLCHFDAAQRGRVTAQGFNFVSYHLVMAQYFFDRLKCPNYLQMARAAGMAWQKAGARPGECAHLTPNEYAAMRAGLKVYFRTLPQIEAGTYRQGCNIADQLMK